MEFYTYMRSLPPSSAEIKGVVLHRAWFSFSFESRLKLVSHFCIVDKHCLIQVKVRRANF